MVIKRLNTFNEALVEMPDGASTNTLYLIREIISNKYGPYTTNLDIEPSYFKHVITASTTHFTVCRTKDFDYGYMSIYKGSNKKRTNICC